MGYTHYWSSTVEPTDKQWTALTAAVRSTLGMGLPPTTADYAGDTHPDGKPMVIDDDEIAFNGVGDDAHETFCLEREPRGFDFCKTAEKPYDLVVTIVMVLAHHHCPGIWDFTSDGDELACKAAIKWLHLHDFGLLDNPVKED